ncbi:MAG: EVE domain-containing protein [Rhodospirillaceae bacterium]
MAYWLLKSEPAKYSWAQMLQDGRTHWDGVRNHQAAANLRAMRLEDKAFFYHSNLGLEIVGIVEIVREFYPDPGDAGGKFGNVDVRPLAALAQPVPLAALKAHPLLSGMALVRQSRLSVCPVGEAEWHEICRLGGIAA